jgi:hypothetical protein
VFETTVKHDKGEITKDELRVRLELFRESDRMCEYEIPVVALHFYAFSVWDVDKLSWTAPEGTLSDRSPAVRDDDSVFEFVHRRVLTHLSYFGLLDFVRFEFVSADCMESALDFISSSFESLTFGIWSSLRSRLTLTLTPDSPPGRSCLPAIDSKIC